LQSIVSANLFAVLPHLSDFHSLASGSVLGYIGPGAGFALAGSFPAVFGAIVSAISMVLLWPIRRILRFLLRTTAAQAAF
jgi:hypothetical protein